MKCLWILIREIYNLNPMNSVDLGPQFYFAILIKYVACKFLQFNNSKSKKGNLSFACIFLYKIILDNHYCEFIVILKTSIFLESSIFQNKLTSKNKQIL